MASILAAETFTAPTSADLSIATKWGDCMRDSFIDGTAATAAAAAVVALVGDVGPTDSENVNA